MLGDTVSKWIPEQSPKAIAHLGKLGEECCELGKALFRSIIQGIDGLDPKEIEQMAKEVEPSHPSNAATAPYDGRPTVSGNPVITDPVEEKS